MLRNCPQESRRVYKTAHYEYSSGNNVNNNASQPIAAIGKDVQQNINSLDSLLLDLKHERERSLERAGGEFVEHKYTNEIINTRRTIGYGVSVNKHDESIRFRQRKRDHKMGQMPATKYYIKTHTHSVTYSHIAQTRTNGLPLWHTMDVAGIVRSLLGG